MKQVLMVAEKPNLAETISRILGGNGVHTGNSRTVLFEWDAVWPSSGEVVHFKMTSTYGHIYSRAFDEEHENWKVNPEDLFSCPVKLVEVSPEKRLADGIRDLARGVDYLVLWLDCDREGENICFEIINIAMPVMNSRSFGEKVYRARFSALSEREIQDSFANLQRPNANEAVAVDARRELDLRIGCAFTRFQTIHLKRKYGVGALKTATIPYGPCQTPTLAFCVERHKQVERFEGQKFWNVNAWISLPGNDTVQLKSSRGRVFDLQEAESILEKIRTAQSVRVVNIRSNTRRRLRPPALNTVQLLRLASTRLRISPKRAMEFAEELYMYGCISYPRTETTRYPPSFDRMAALGVLRGHPELGKYAEALMYSVPDSHQSGVDMGDHPPIIPLSARPKRRSKDQARDEKRQEQAESLFQMICSYFLAGLASDLVFEEKTITFDADGERFTLDGIESVMQSGFTEILQEQRVKTKRIPNLSRDQMIAIRNVELEEGKTAPPMHLTESELIDLMEKHGIGTDASMAAHIASIFERKFAVLNEERRIVPSPIGIALIEAYNALDPDLAKPQIRATLEKDISLIAQGHVQKDQIVNHVLSIYRAKYQFLVANISIVESAIARVLHLPLDQPAAVSRRSGCGMRGKRGRNDSSSDRRSGGGRDDRRDRERKSPPPPVQHPDAGFSPVRRQRSPPPPVQRTDAGFSPVRRHQPNGMEGDCDINSKLAQLASPAKLPIPAGSSSDPRSRNREASPRTPLKRVKRDDCCSDKTRPSRDVESGRSHSPRRYAGSREQRAVERRSETRRADHPPSERSIKGNDRSHGSNDTRSDPRTSYASQERPVSGPSPVVPKPKLDLGNRRGDPAVKEETDWPEDVRVIIPGRLIGPGPSNVIVKLESIHDAFMPVSQDCTPPALNLPSSSSASQLPPNPTPNRAAPTPQFCSPILPVPSSCSTGNRSSVTLPAVSPFGCGQVSAVESGWNEEMVAQNRSIPQQTFASQHLVYSVEPSQPVPSTTFAQRPCTKNAFPLSDPSTSALTEPLPVVNPATQPPFTKAFTQNEYPAVAHSHRPAVVRSVAQQNFIQSWKALQSAPSLRKPIAAITGTVQSREPTPNLPPSLNTLGTELPSTPDPSVPIQPVLSAIDGLEPEEQKHVPALWPPAHEKNVHITTSHQKKTSVKAVPKTEGRRKSKQLLDTGEPYLAASGLFRPPGFSIAGKDCVQSVYEYCAKSQISAPDFVMSGSGISFEATLNVSGIKYGPGKGCNKKAAKKEAAVIFLRAAGYNPV